MPRSETTPDLVLGRAAISILYKADSRRAIDRYINYFGGGLAPVNGPLAVRHSRRRLSPWMPAGLRRRAAR